MKLNIKTYSTTCILLKRSEYPVLDQVCIQSNWILQFTVINHHYSSSCSRKTNRFSLPIALCSIRELCASNPASAWSPFIYCWLMDFYRSWNMKKVDQQLLCVRIQKQVHKQQGAMRHFFPIWNKIIYTSSDTLLLWDSSHQPNYLLELYGNKIKTDWKKSQLKEDKWKTKGEWSLMERKGQILVIERNWDIWYISLNET